MPKRVWQPVPKQSGALPLHCFHLSAFVFKNIVADVQNPYFSRPKVQLSTFVFIYIVAEIANSFVFINIVGLTPDEFFLPFVFCNIVGHTPKFGGPPAWISPQRQLESAKSLFFNKAILTQIM
jgi:hypothetical protein